MKDRTAGKISALTIPPVLSAIAFAILGLTLEKGVPRLLLITGICWLAASIVPITYVQWLRRRGKVTHKHIPIRQQRTRPYLVGTASYMLGLIALLVERAPLLIWGLMFCYCSNTLVIALINLRWKMSAHAMGAAGALAGLHFALGITIIPFYLLLPAVGWARIQLKAHTVGQVVAGAVSGLVLTFGQLQVLSLVFG